jgi:hypothetical protein
LCWSVKLAILLQIDSRILHEMWGGASSLDRSFGVWYNTARFKQYYEQHCLLREIENSCIEGLQTGRGGVVGRGAAPPCGRFQFRQQNRNQYQAYVEACRRHTDLSCSS